MRTAVQIAAAVALAGTVAGCGWFGPAHARQAPAPASSAVGAPVYEPAPVPPRELLEREP